MSSFPGALFPIQMAGFQQVPGLKLNRSKDVLRVKIILGTAYALVLICIPWQAQAAIKILYPPEDVWISTDTLQVVGMLDEEQDTLVSVEVQKGQLLGNGRIPVMGGAFNCTVRLRRGENRIIVTSRTSEASRSVYLATSAREGPKGLKRYHIHPPLEILPCNTCHALTGKSASYEKVLPTRGNCTDGECHPKIGSGKYVHGPLGTKSCVSCHNPHGSVLPNEISSPEPDLCISCHVEAKRMFDEKVIMPPVRDGKCIVCHDPHQSSQRFQLRGTTLEGLCFTCHDKKIIEYNTLHGPTQKGDCIAACHMPHSAPYKGLLPEENENFCFLCHKERREQFQKKFRHKPQEENCNDCHEPHGSNFAFQLKDKEPTLCYSCHRNTHPEVVRDCTVAKVKHGALKEGKCTSCHTPHSTDFQKQLKADLRSICFGCHKEIKDQIASRKYLHGALKENNCNACHKPHGGSYAELLIRYYTQEFYTEFEPWKYALCFECHNNNIVKDKQTTEVTNFRNGSENLHYFHVVRKKGRTCRTCHEAHAGNQAKHIRTEIPFGTWSYTIEFTMGTNGGTCVVGCHKPRSYNRVRAVESFAGDL